MSRRHKALMEYTLEHFDELITRYNLDINKEVTNYGFSITLENADNSMSVYYGTHPYDYPFYFDVRYCKQSFFNKRNVLYKTDTEEITSLWGFGKDLNTKISTSLEQDIPMIDKCCQKAIEMFEYFEKMSSEEYLIAHKKFSQDR